MPLLDDLGGWPNVLTSLLDRIDLDQHTASAAMASMLSGESTSAQIAAFLIALRAKGETSVELAAMLQEVRKAATPLPLGADLLHRAIDVVGTGGDRSHSVNVSTMAGLVVAGAGVPVVKHGNRAASSQCGTADVLEALGVAIDLDAVGVEACVRESGFGFVFAQKFHPAFAYVGPTRKEIGVPTIFNLLGPLANPAAVENMLVGVRDAATAHIMAQALVTRGVKRAWLVHGDGGLDELSTSGPSTVVMLVDGKTEMTSVDPRDIGIPLSPLSAIKGGSPNFNANIVRQLVAGDRGAVRDIVLLNAAAALFIVGAANSLDDGRSIAEASIDSGATMRCLETLVAISQGQGKRL